jgi:hypothetical protein
MFNMSSPFPSVLVRHRLETETFECRSSQTGKYLPVP